MDREPRRQADCGLGLRTARHSAIGGDDAAPVEGRARRGGKPVQARGAVGRQSRRSEGHERGLRSCARTSNGAAWASSRNRRCACATPLRSGTPSSAFSIPGIRVTDPKAAQCGEVLKGVLKPAQCKLFGNECTPEQPVGALMVSSEGSCAAFYNYEHRKAAGQHRFDVLKGDYMQATPPRSVFAIRRSRWRMARAARPAAV